MLTQENIDILCRVGPGTPMGDVMRRYWIPLVYSWELEADGAPKRVRCLGENLVAYRTSDGSPAFLADACPHRGASMFFGRNEENGLRCVYHGWKFDAAGACVDMPNEPAESNFKHKIRATAYRAADWGRIVWIYMGPDQAGAPELPQWEWCLVPENQLQHTAKAVYECNYMQAVEGELDTSHAPFLHGRLGPDIPGAFGGYQHDKSPLLETVDTEYGVLYGARRQEDDNSYYWRTTQFLFPFYGMFPGGGQDGTVPLSIYVPVDDGHTLHMGVRWHPSKPLPGDGRPVHVAFRATGENVPGVGPVLPHQGGKFSADWWPEANGTNDFKILRDVQKTKNYTGIGSVRLQDYALIYSMGPIMDRTKEHLGTADGMIIRVRRRLIQAAIALREHGTPPPGSNLPQSYKVRSCQAILPMDQDWRSALDDWHNARTTMHPTGGFTPARPI